MQLYNCTVRLNGTLTNNVFKSDVTAAEIEILRRIHGQSESSNDPVFEIQAFDWREGPDDDEGKPTRYRVPKGTVNRSAAAEKQRLAMTYSAGEMSGRDIVDSVLGAGATPVPLVVEGIEVPEDETPKPARVAIPVVTPDVPPVRTRVPARASAESVTL